MTSFEPTDDRKSKPSKASSEAPQRLQDKPDPSLNPTLWPRNPEESLLPELVAPSRQKSTIERSAEPTPTELSATHKPAFSPRAYLDALRECAAAASVVVSGLWHSLPRSTAARAAIVAAVGSTAAVATLFAPSQALGIAAGIVIISGLAYRENHLIRAQSSIGQSLFALHLISLGAWPAVTLTVLSAVRPAFLSMVSEDSKTLRIIGGIVGFGVAASFYSFTMLEIPVIQLRNVPLMVMALSSLAEALPRRLSWGTRLSYLACATSLIPYHSLVSGSWMGTGVNIFSIGTIIHSAVKNDLSKKQMDGGAEKNRVEQ